MSRHSRLLLPLLLQRTAWVAGLFKYSFILATASGSAVPRAVRTFATISASR
jgi:hypothetical protein